MSELFFVVLVNVLGVIILVSCVYFPVRWAILFTQHLEKKWGK